MLTVYLWARAVLFGPRPCGSCGHDTTFWSPSTREPTCPACDELDRRFPYREDLWVDAPPWVPHEIMRIRSESRSETYRWLES